MRAAVVMFVCVLSMTLSAQWAPFVRSEVPKTADFKEDQGVFTREDTARTTVPRSA